MSLSINSTLLKLAQGSFKASVHLEFEVQLEAGGTRTFQAVKAPSPVYDSDSGAHLPNIISAVTPVAYGIDPLTRAPSVSALQIDIKDDGTGHLARNLVFGGYAKGVKIIATWGDPSVAVADWAPLWGGVIKDILPVSGSARIMCTGAGALPKGTKKAGLWAGAHPFELAADMLNWGGVPDSMLETASFAYDIATDISHYVARRVDVAWDGGDVLDVAAAGAIDDAKVFGWSLAGISIVNSNQGRVYPVVTVIAPGHILVEVYDHYTSGDLIARGEVRGTALASDNYWVALAPPMIDVNGQSQPAAYGISGGVFVAYSGGSFTIAIASTSYVSGDAAQYGSEIDVYDAVQSLARMCNASVVEREDGKLEMLRFDASTAAVAHWDDSTILAPGFEVQTIAANIINQVLVQNKYRRPGVSEWVDIDREVKIERQDSQGHYSVDGGVTDNIMPHVISNEWANAVAVLASDITAGDNSFTVGRVAVRYSPISDMVRNFGMCGTGGVTAGPTQAAGRKAASGDDRYLYWLIDDGANKEIVKVGTSAIGSTGNTVTITDPQTGGSVTRYQTFQVNGSSISRNAIDLGGVASAFKKGSMVFDVTMAVETCLAILDRFEDGCPIVMCATTLAEFEVQVGDFVTSDTDQVYGLGFDGLDDTIKMEVIRKAPDVIANRIGWTLARVAPSGTTSNSYGIEDLAPRLPGGPRGARGGGALDGLFNIAVNSESIDHDRTDNWVADDHYDWDSSVGGKNIHDDNIVASNINQHEGVIGTINLTGDTSIGKAGQRNSDFGATTRAIATNEPDNWEKASASSWGAAGDIYVNAVTKLSGVHSLHFRSAASAGTDHIASDYEPVKAGCLYSISADVWGDSANAGDVASIKILWYTTAKVYISSSDLFANKQITAAAWEREGPVFCVAPATAAYKRIQLIKITT